MARTRNPRTGSTSRGQGRQPSTFRMDEPWNGDEQSILSELSDEFFLDLPWGGDNFAQSVISNTSDVGDYIPLPKSRGARTPGINSGRKKGHSRLPRKHEANQHNNIGMVFLPPVGNTCYSGLSSRASTSHQSISSAFSISSNVGSRSMVHSRQSQRLLGEILSLHGQPPPAKSIPCKHTVAPGVSIFGTTAIRQAPFSAFQPTHPAWTITRCARQFAPNPARPHLFMPEVPGVSHPEHLTLRGMPRGTARTLDALSETQYLRGRLQTSTSRTSSKHPISGRFPTSGRPSLTRTNTADLAADAVSLAAAGISSSSNNICIPSSKLRLSDDISMNSEYSMLVDAAATAAASAAGGGPQRSRTRSPAGGGRG